MNSTAEQTDSDARHASFSGTARNPLLAKLYGLTLRAYNNVNKRAARAYLAARVVRPSQPLRFALLGEGEGAWNVPVDLLKRDGIAYCVGVGANSSFDQALAHDPGMRVYSIDPTPIAIDHMGKLARDRSRHVFLPIGVWNSDTVLRLYAPMSASSNLSSRDIHGTGRFIELPCKTLSTIMAEQGHAAIDLLKVDIEGSWFEVIEDLCRRKIPVSVLCAEFDTPTSVAKARTALRLLREHGLILVDAQRENLVFVQEHLLVSR